MPRAGVDAGRALLSATGSLWVPTDAAALLLVLGAGLVLWVQYRHRRTWLARSIAGSASVAAYLVLMTMTWQTAFAVQKVLSRNPAAASLVDVGMAEQCFSIRKADGAGFFRYGDQRFGPDPRDEEQLHLAGPGALAFSTRLVPHSMPEGHRLVVNRADLTYQAGGRVVVHAPSRSLLMGMPGGAYGSVFDNRWMLNRNDQQRLAATPGIEAHFVYSLSLLKPVASATIEAGAPRRYLPGIGYCSASVGAGAPQAGANVIEVNCFKPGSQPAQLTAVLEGAPEYQGSNFRATDFTPAALELWSGEYYRTSMFTRQLPLPRVRLAAYEASAHFDREIVVPGVLGGSLASCPLPSGADKIQ
jgi:hypothetical protein